MSTKNIPKILFRCDSSSMIGLGHLSRCLILANGLKNHFKIIFVVKSLEGNQNHRIIENGHTYVDLGTLSFADHIIAHSPVLTIVDHYEVSLEEERELCSLCDVLIFDDEFKPHEAKFVLNHSFVATKKRYESLVPSTTTLLTGSKYALIHEDFFTQKHQRPSKIKNILISLGGSDPLGLSYKIAKTIKAYSPKLEVAIVTTSSNPMLPFLKRCYKNLIVDESSMAKRMNAYDLIITSASTSFLETLCLQKPFIAIQCAANQEATYQEIKHLTTALDRYLTAKFRRAMAHLNFEQTWQNRLFQKNTFHRGGVAKMIIQHYAHPSFVATNDFNKNAEVLPK